MCHCVLWENNTYFRIWRGKWAEGGVANFLGRKTEETLTNQMFQAPQTLLFGAENAHVGDVHVYMYPWFWRWQSSGYLSVYMDTHLADCAHQNVCSIEREKVTLWLQSRRSLFISYYRKILSLLSQPYYFISLCLGFLVINQINITIMVL